MKNKTKIVAGGTFALLLLGVATTASAFSGDVAQRLGLSDNQLAALEEAHELRRSGDHEAAKLIIEDAGIDLSELREVRKEHRQAVKETIQSGDYDAFVDVVGDGKLSEIIENESDFNKLVEAHELRGSGDREGAKEIMEDLGFEGPPKRNGEGKQFKNR